MTVAATRISALIPNSKISSGKSASIGIEFSVATYGPNTRRTNLIRAIAKPIGMPATTHMAKPRLKVFRLAHAAGKTWGKR